MKMENPLSLNFEWKNDYSIGVEEIDYQHKRFLAFIKKIYQLEQQNSETSEVNDLIRELEKYLQFHVKSEEFMMELYSYPKQDKQKEEHAKILKEVKNQVGKLSQSQGHLTDLLLFLKRWFENHTTSLDRDFGEHVKKQRGGLYMESDLA